MRHEVSGRFLEKKLRKKRLTWAHGRWRRNARKAQKFFVPLFFKKAAASCLIYVHG
jgi:hypothetical protein